MPTLYRIENQTTNVGLWYNSEGVKTDFIKHGIQDGMNRDLPMEPNEEYTKGGRWFSACDDIPMMRNWFSSNDLVQFEAAGYGLYQIEIPEYRQQDGHAIFLREKIISIVQIPISTLDIH